MRRDAAPVKRVQFAREHPCDVLAPAAMYRPTEDTTMRRPRTLFLIAALALPTVTVTTSAFADEGKEETVKLSDIPAPARETLRREARGAPIVKVEKEHEGGRTTYEAHVKPEKGSEIGIVVDAKGNLIGQHSEENEQE
jgi:hypothetical protein